LFVLPQHDLGRFSGILELLNVARVNDGAIVKPISWDNPIPNPDKHLLLAEQLTSACRWFFHCAEDKRPMGKVGFPLRSRSLLADIAYRLGSRIKIISSYKL
jgi:hypothetical protein